jgi:hypothetical protein
VTATTSLPVEGELPDLDGATAWLNSAPLTPEGLRGSVIAVQLCTFSCVNWLRTLPYVAAWAAKYREHGLVVVGAHSPEFPFEHDLDGIRAAQYDRYERSRLALVGPQGALGALLPGRRHRVGGSGDRGLRRHARRCRRPGAPTPPDRGTRGQLCCHPLVPPRLLGTRVWPGSCTGASGTVPCVNTFRDSGADPRRVQVGVAVIGGTRAGPSDNAAAGGARRVVGSRAVEDKRGRPAP